MREAQHLLYHSDFSVKEIAGKPGFEDEKYFNRLFRKVIGVSPAYSVQQHSSNYSTWLSNETQIYLDALSADCSQKYQQTKYA